MAYTSITEDTLSVIKTPPIYGVASLASGYSASGPTIGKIKSILIQVRTRFIYDDNEKSTWSSISPPSIISGKYNIIGSDSANQFYDNSLYFYTNIPDDPTLTKMDIAVRFGNYGTWYLADTIDISGELGTANYRYDFYNNKSLTGLSQKDVNRPYDYVPLLSGAQEIIGGADGAYLTFGDITEGYDNNISIDVDLTTSFANSSGSGISTVPVTRNSFWEFEFDVPQYSGVEVVISGDGVSNRYVFANGQYFNASTGSIANISQGDKADKLVEDMQGDTLISSATAAVATITIVFYGYIDTPEVQVIEFTGQNVDASFQDGATQFFGIVYGDKYGRYAPVLRSDDTKIEIPFITETNGRAYDQRVRISYTLNHTPPIWAHTWRFVWGRSSISWSQTFALRTHGMEDRSIWREGGYTKIKINQGINDVRDILENYAMPNYIWKKKDRLRIIGTRPVTGASDINEDITPISDLVDVEVLKTDGVYIYTQDWSVYADSGAPDIDNTDYDILVEIYTPRVIDDGDDILYYGIGYVKAVTNPETASRTHASSSGTLTVMDRFLTRMPLVSVWGEKLYIDANASTTTTTSTTTTYAPGEEDVYTNHYGTRYFSVLSMLQSAFVGDSNVFQIGEVHIVNEDYKQVRLNNVRYSGIYIGKTFVNQLNRFEYDDDIPFDDKHGRLFAMEELGYTLKVLQRNKVTSLYIGREMSLDADGNEVLVYSKNVLGTKHPSVEDYGTDQPTGVVVSSRYLYFPDISQGVIVRDANGQEEISKYGMESYFRDLFKYLRGLSTSDYKIIAGVDRSRDLVYFTILDYDTPANTRTLAFDEKARPTQEGRYSPWRSFYSFSTSIEHYGSVGQKSFLTFLSGGLWKHNSDTANRGTFHGAGAATQELWIVSNVSPDMIKHYEAIEVDSNEPWTVADNDSIIIAPSTRYPNGMQSKILSGDWEQYEETFRAAFNFDMLTGDNTNVNMYHLYNGRELSGRNMLVKLKNAETDEVNLFLVKIISNISK